MGKVKKGPRGAIQGSHGAAWFRQTPPRAVPLARAPIAKHCIADNETKVWLSGGHKDLLSPHLNSHSTSTTGALGYGNPTLVPTTPPPSPPTPAQPSPPKRASCGRALPLLPTHQPFSFVPGAWTVSGGPWGGRGAPRAPAPDPAPRPPPPSPFSNRVIETAVGSGRLLQSRRNWVTPG